MVLFLEGDLDNRVVGKGTVNLRTVCLTGEREGDEGTVGSFREEADEGEQEARVRVREETFGAESSGISARGTSGKGTASL